jgi:hypothetical protein
MASNRRTSYTIFIDDPSDLLPSKSSTASHLVTDRRASIYSSLSTTTNSNAENGNVYPFFRRVVREKRGNDGNKCKHDGVLSIKSLTPPANTMIADEFSELLQGSSEEEFFSNRRQHLSIIGSQIFTLSLATIEEEVEMTVSRHVGKSLFNLNKYEHNIANNTVAQK